MPSNFPASLDTFAAKKVIDLEDALEAVEAKIGVAGSAVTSSLDYKVSSAGLQATLSGTYEEPLVPASPVNAVQDTANAAAILAAGNPLILRSGEYRWNALPVTGPAEIRGAGDRTRVRNLTGTVMTVSGRAVNVRDLVIWSDGGASSVVQSASFSESAWQRFGLVQLANGFSCWDNAGFEAVDLRFDNFSSTHVQTASVPSWKFIGVGGQINHTRWSNGRHTSSGNYAFWIETTTANAQYGPVWVGVTFEICTGGGIKLIGCRDYLIEDCPDWDLASGEGGVITLQRHFILAATGPEGIPCIGTIRRHNRKAGALGVGISDIVLPSGGGGAGTIIDSCHNVGILDPLVVDTLGNTCTVIYGAPANLSSILATGGTLATTRLGSSEAWVAVTAFQGLWVNDADTGTGPVSYRRSDDGRHVELSGVVMAGVSGTAVFTLPAGYRPPTLKVGTSLNLTTGAAIGVVITTAGVVTIHGGAATDQRSLDGVVFALDV